MVDGSGNNNEFVARFVFEEVKTNDYDKVLSPVLRWTNSSGTYELDMSSLIKKLNDNTALTGFFPAEKNIYTLYGQYSPTPKLELQSNIYQKWYVSESGSKLRPVDVNKYYRYNQSDAYQPINGEYYIEVDRKGVIAPINTARGYISYKSDDGTSQLEHTEYTDNNGRPRVLYFLNMGVFGRFKTENGIVPEASNITGRNFIYANTEEISIKTTAKYYKPVMEPDGVTPNRSTYISVTKDFILDKYTMCSPSTTTTDYIPNEYFSSSYREQDDSGHSWCYYTFPYDMDETELSKYVDIYKPNIRPDIPLLGFTSDIIKYSIINIGNKTHCTYDELMGNGDSDEFTPEYTWLKTYEGL